MSVHDILKTLKTSSKPAHFDIEKVVRPNILALHPYRCARDDYKEGVLLDANENALGHSIIRSQEGEVDADLQSTLDLNLHRYPDPSHDAIKERIAALRSIPGPQNVFLGVGSDEVIDLLIRVCVTPTKEKILVTPPTYGMYGVCAQVNDVGVVKCPLELTGKNGEGGESGRYSVRVDEVRRPNMSIIFIPNLFGFVIDEEGDRCRPFHKNDHPLLARKPYWHTCITFLYPFIAGIRKL